MARVQGKAGQVTVAAAEVTGIKAWSVDKAVDAVETTAFDSVGVHAFLPGCSKWSGTFEGPKNAAPLTIGTEIALILKEDTGAATKQFSGQAIITGLHGKTDIAGVVTYSYDFQGTGALQSPDA